MSAVLFAPSVSKIRWKLRSVMADRKISNKVLATAIGMNPVSISKLKNADELPEIGGEALAKLCDAITQLSGAPCGITELLEHVFD